MVLVAAMLQESRLNNQLSLNLHFPMLSHASRQCICSEHASHPQTKHDECRWVRHHDLCDGNAEGIWYSVLRIDFTNYFDVLNYIVRKQTIHTILLSMS